MANVRTLNKDKFNINKYRFRELYYFCLQYNEWRERLKESRNPLNGMQYSGMPGSGVPGDPTMRAGIESAELSKKIDMVIHAAKKADPELYDYIIYAATNENITFKYLKNQMGIPCESDRYYDRRRKFYFYLDQILKNGLEK